MIGMSMDSPQIPTDILQNYKKVVESELGFYCDKVLSILEDKLIKQEQSKQKNSGTLIFYLKMAADYYRYKAEYNPNDSNKNNCKKYYENAYEIAKNSLRSTHPTRLGLALNFSVFYWEILDEKEKACQLAKNAFDTALQNLDELNAQNYKNSTLIMQLIRDNLTLWTDPDNNDNIKKQ